MKKLIIALTAAACVASLATAEEAKKEAGPKVGIEFSQRMDATTVDGVSAQSDAYDVEALYSRTEIKAGAAYQLSETVTLTPSVKDRLEAKMNPGKLDTATAGALDTTKLGKIRYRNRFYANLDSSVKFSDLLNLGVGFEYRLATDLRTDKDGDVLPEYRLSPTVSLSGKAGDISYSVSQLFGFTLDSSVGDYDNSHNNNLFALDGTYAAGYGVKLSDAATVKFDVSDNLVYTFANAVDLDLVENYLIAKATLVNGSFAPSVGFIMNTNTLDGDTTDSVMGAQLGASFTSGKYSFSGAYDLGVNTASGKDNQREDHLSFVLKIKS